MARSIGLLGLNFLPNAGNWEAVHRGRRDSPDTHRRVSSTGAPHHPQGRTDLAGRSCWRATTPRKLLSLMPGHRLSSLSWAHTWRSSNVLNW
jgi:hypothetical protein